MDKIEFKKIFDECFDNIRSYIYYRCTDEETASDLAQEVFMRIWEKRDRLNSDSLKPLLYKIAHDLVVSHYRRQSVQLDFEKTMQWDETIDSPQEDMQFVELKRQYADALAGLSDKIRETFLMSRNDELKYQEIAQRLGISLKAVEKRMSTALFVLKQKLL